MEQSSVTTKAFISKYSDLVLAMVVVGMVGMLIVPLPTFILDLLLTLNIATAVTLLMVSLYIPSAVKLASFPTILLLTTLFRLALNVSSTRLILLQADAGEVIEAFGNFVVQGNYVVGGVIFLILTIIQFLVIAKGSERVSEVGARFTLDAMPGKQMSIDADLRAGAFDLTEARRRRAAVQRESQLYGAMDGAMKFVKGDAIAGIIMTGVNIIAGMVVGIMQLEMSAGDAAKTYTLLTIGDGLVSQIPALLISLTAGIIVTRVAGDEETNLGKDIFGQIMSYPKALAIAAGLLFAFAIIPGLPTVPFVLLGSGLAAIAYRLMGRGGNKATEVEQVAQEVKEEAREQAAQVQVLFPSVMPMSIDLGSELVKSLSEERIQWLKDTIGSMREGVFFETGVKVPNVRVRTDGRNVREWGIGVSIEEIPVESVEFPQGKVFVAERPEALTALGLEVEATTHPMTRRPASWVKAEDASVVEGGGFKVWDGAGYALIRLTASAKANVSRFIGVQETQAMLEQLEGPFPATVQEVVPRQVSLQQLTEVLKRLAEEGISIRNLRGILEILADRARGETDPIVLTERVREGLSRFITHQVARPDGSVVAYLVDRELEDIVSGAVRHAPDGSYLALPPDVTREILAAVRRCVQSDIEKGKTPVLLADQSVRRYIKRLVSLEFPECMVLGFQELDPAHKIQPLGRVAL